VIYLCGACLKTTKIAFELYNFESVCRSFATSIRDRNCCIRTAANGVCKRGMCCLRLRTRGWCGECSIRLTNSGHMRHSRRRNIYKALLEVSQHSDGSVTPKNRPHDCGQGG
jgi:hypothetical protein